MNDTRPTVEFFVVIGNDPKGPGAFGAKVYGETETKEGAELLKEEAEKTGWSKVYIRARRRSTY